MAKKRDKRVSTVYKRNYYARSGLKDTSLPMLISHYSKLCALRERTNLPFRVIINNMLRYYFDSITDEQGLDALAIQVQEDAVQYSKKRGTHLGEPIKLNKPKA